MPVTEGVGAIACVPKILPATKLLTFDHETTEETALWLAEASIEVSRKAKDLMASNPDQYVGGSLIGADLAKRVQFFSPLVDPSNFVFEEPYYYTYDRVAAAVEALQA